MRSPEAEENQAQSVTVAMTGHYSSKTLDFPLEMPHNMQT